MAYKIVTYAVYFFLFIFCSPWITKQAFASYNKDTTETYIVVFNSSVTNPYQTVSDMETAQAVKAKHIYAKAIKGFAAQMDAKKLETIKVDPRVKFVVADRPVAIEGKGRKPKPTATPTPSPIPVNEYPNGIRRIGIPTTTGNGLSAAVIDTGISLSHPEFSGKIIAQTSCVDGVTSGNDDNGHGTHVAGTIAAAKNGTGVAGVAPGANLVAVKVLDVTGGGTWSSVICGIEYVTAHAALYNIKVANMSLGGGGSSDNNCGNTNNDPLHMALCNSAAAGITYVVAAMNNSADVSNFAPAAYDDTVITVSALTDSDGLSGGNGPYTPYGPDDTFATFSNYGVAVDFGAPGVDIYSTFVNGSYQTLSGTSMASPHVAGAALLYTQSHPGATWTQVRDGLKTLAEPIGQGHTDPTGLHPEPVVRTISL